MVALKSVAFARLNNAGGTCELRAPLHSKAVMECFSAVAILPQRNSCSRTNSETCQKFIVIGVAFLLYKSSTSQVTVKFYCVIMHYIPWVVRIHNKHKH